MYTKEQQAKCVGEFALGFARFMDDNPEILEQFAEAWYNADNKTINAIVSDYIMELEEQQ